MLRLASSRLVRSSCTAGGRRWLAAASEALHVDEIVGAPGPLQSGSSAAASPKVLALVDELVSLNVLEVKALTDSLKDRLGIDDSAVMPMMNPAMFAGMGAPGGGGVGAAAVAEEPVVEKTAFDLKLEAYDAAKKIAVIKEIRAITGLGLKEAKALVDEAPNVFKNAVAKEEAEEIRDKLKEIGATVALE
jgi:large subunit ribosomal protein L7/L12